MVCQASARGSLGSGPPTTKVPRCTAGRLTQRLAMARAHRHDMDSIIVDGRQLYFCRECGARGSANWRSLLEPCLRKPRTRHYRYWLEKTMAGPKVFAGRSNLRPQLSTRPLLAGPRPATPRANRQAHTARKATALSKFTAADVAMKNPWTLLAQGACATSAQRASSAPAAAPRAPRRCPRCRACTNKWRATLHRGIPM